MWPPLAEERGGGSATLPRTSDAAWCNGSQNKNTRLTTLPKTMNKIKDLRQIDRKSLIECFLLKTKENIT